MSTQVKTFMKSPVFSCALPADVGTIRDLMVQKECHAIPLVELGENKEIQIRGIVTSDDLLGVYDDTVDIQQVMSRKVHVVSQNSNAQSAARMMLRHNCHHLLVMEEGEIVGIISSIDFAHLVAEKGI